MLSSETRMAVVLWTLQRRRHYGQPLSKDLKMTRRFLLLKKTVQIILKYLEAGLVARAEDAVGQHIADPRRGRTDKVMQ